MVTYRELRERQQAEFNKFPFFCAFDEKQFAEGKRKLGVVEDSEVRHYYAGMYYRKADTEALRAMMRRFDDERKAAFKDDSFLYDAFYHELANHEYCITYDDEPTLEALGLTVEELEEDQRMGKIYLKARKDYLGETY